MGETEESVETERFPSNAIIGVNRRSYPSQFPIMGSPYVDIAVVLVSGEIGDYAAYIGSGSDEFIKSQGNKLAFEEAQIHFCHSLERERYRD